MQEEEIVKKGKVFGKLLYFFAVYTLTIKYLMPITWAMVKGVRVTSYIYFWDAWWVFHLLVGYGFVGSKKNIWIWGFLLAVAEIMIITVKFFFYIREPNYGFWHLNWFVNKSLMLVYFWGFLYWLIEPEVRRFYGKKT